MSFKAAFRSLQEVFPQVDLRILKAVAIEHSKDVDAAVEFILSDVLPFISGPPETLHSVHGSQEIKYPSADAELNNLGFFSNNVEEANASFFSEPRSVVCEITPGADPTSAAFPVKSPYMEEANASPLSGPRAVACENATDTDHTSAALPIESACMEEANASHFSGTRSVACEYVPGGSLPFKSIYMEEAEGVDPLNNLPSGHEVFEETNVTISSEPTLVATENDLASETFHVKAPELYDPFVENLLSVPSENGPFELRASAEEATSLEKHEVKSCQGSFAATSFVECENANISWPGAQHAEIQDFLQLEADYTVPAACSTSQHFTSPSLEENTDNLEYGLVEQKNINSLGSQYEEHPISSVQNGDDQMIFGTEIGAIDNKYHPASIATRSGQVVSIDFLEDFIADAKNNKKTLVSTMESVVGMMKEVELHEREANQAKEEASKAGLDILAKVEDLKQMLKHAKEANDMHAGEVYGEKSILATEARELQSRLLSLSDERDKSLSTIEEMDQTLKARVAAAYSERVAAEQEKLEKEKMAREALAEQELVMDKVVQESKNLLQEAQENSKLREFLMDRGRMVDVLQGEISVICEDVMSLKERVDGRVPLSKSLPSSHGICSLASSSSSHKSALSDGVPNHVELAESPSREFPESHQLEGHPKCSGKSVASSDHKASSDDDWELFDDEGETCG